MTRGDLRQHVRKSEMEQRIWSYLHSHPSQLVELIRNENIDYQMIVTEIMLIADIFQFMNEDMIEHVNMIYPLIVDGTILHEEIEHCVIKFICQFKQKFELTIQSKSSEAL
jgi:hypothetical protein